MDLFRDANIEKARLGEAWGLSEIEKHDLVTRGAIIEFSNVKLLLDSEIVKMWLDDRRIEAVREYRRLHNVGLEEALDFLQKIVIDRQ